MVYWWEKIQTKVGIWFFLVVLLSCPISWSLCSARALWGLRGHWSFGRRKSKDGGPGDCDTARSDWTQPWGRA